MPEAQLQTDLQRPPTTGRRDLEVPTLPSPQQPGLDWLRSGRDLPRGWAGRAGVGSEVGAGEGGANSEGWDKERRAEAVVGRRD